MRKVVFALMALLAATQVSTAAPGSAREPILGVTWGGGGRVALLDPLTLAPVRRSGVRVVAGYSVAVSSDGTMVAVASGSTLRVLDAHTLRVLRTLRWKERWLGASAWPTPNRLVTVPSWFLSGSAIVLDPLTGEVVSDRPLDGAPLAFAPTRDGIVLLLGRSRRIGAVRLAIARADGSLRSVPLPGLHAGFSPPARGQVVSLEAQPGLAIASSGRRAAVVVPGLVADVDLTTMSVTTHRLELRRPASARKAFSGWSRAATWMSGSTLAVTGTDYEASADGRQLRQTPAGLVFVDTRTWTVRIVEPEASEITRAGSTLLATGVRCDPGVGQCHGVGLRGYTATGRLRFHLFDDESLSTTELSRGLAYLSDCNSYCYRIIDPAAGRLLASITTKQQTVLIP